jgi:hypothetical protein
MSYTKVNWENFPSRKTPLSAENLNLMDNTIAALDSDMATAKSNVTELLSDMSTAKGNITDLLSDMVDAKGDITDLDTRVDNLATIPSGSTTADLEVIDIRLGYDNSTAYQNAGTAVRTQIGDLHDRIDDIGLSVSLSGRLQVTFTE